MDKRRKDITDLRNIDNRHMENMFVVKTDSDSRRYYDLTDTLFVTPDSINPVFLTEHTVTSTDNLYVLSNTYYGTKNLWWVIASVNNIEDPFSLPKLQGETINIPNKTIVGNILSFMNG